MNDDIYLWKIITESVDHVSSSLLLKGSRRSQPPLVRPLPDTASHFLRIILRWLGGYLDLLLLLSGQLVDTDNLVREAGEEFHARSVPGEGVAGKLAFADSLGLFLGSGFVGLDGDFDVGDDWFVFLGEHVVDLETVVVSDGNPLEFGVEGDGVDGGTNVEFTSWGGEVVDVPDADVSVLATGSEVTTIWSNGEGVDEGIVSLDGEFDLEVGGPDLEETVPTDCGDVWVLLGWGVSDTGNPVSVWLLGEGELALSEGVPESDFTVRATRQDLSVVWGESNGEDFLGVTGEEAG